MGGERDGEDRHLFSEGRGTVERDKKRLVLTAEWFVSGKSICITAVEGGVKKESFIWLVDKVENLLPRTGTYL